LPRFAAKSDIFYYDENFLSKSVDLRGTKGEMIAPDSSPPAESSATASEEVATVQEVEGAIWELSPEDLEKLMLIANHFCRYRGISNRTMEPEELLGEAIRCTLTLRKKWRRGISIIRHLDRAMENISGHTLDRAYRESAPVDREGIVVAIEDFAIATDSVSDEVDLNETYNIVKKAFADDPEAWSVLKLRMMEHSAEQIRETLTLSDCEYETVAKRIRRQSIKLRFKLR